MDLFQLDPKDNVGISFVHRKAGRPLILPDGGTITLPDDIPAGHKAALRDIAAGEPVIKYGSVIGTASEAIPRGGWVHTHNLATTLSEARSYTYEPVTKPVEVRVQVKEELRMFTRKNGRRGIRNELWVIPTVGCVNSSAAAIVEGFRNRHKEGEIDGVFTFPHPFGCSQLGDDHLRTRTLLQNICLNPNAGGVLVLGLGCENNQITAFRETLPEDHDPERFRYLESQAVTDEIAEGIRLLEELYEQMKTDRRSPAGPEELVIGLECGGSDAFSGITANPLVGWFSDYLISRGGTTVLTEVPEMFGAEHILMEQCGDRRTFDLTVKMINDFKEYYLSHGLPVYENPSPGNKKGGISTLEDKSLGCTRKAGNSPVKDVLAMEERVRTRGLNLLASPGNDIVATTALGAAGCQMVLFTTGRGTPLGGFIPTVKISSNSALAEKKPGWIDFDAGVLTGQEARRETVLEEFIRKVMAFANGEKTSAELRNSREIALFKTGVTL